MRSTSESVTRPAPRAKCTERLAQRAARGAETRSFHRVFRRQKQLWDRNQSEEVLDFGTFTNLFSFLIFMPFMADKLQSPTAPSSCDWTRHLWFIRKSLPGIPRAFAKKTECSWGELGRILAQQILNPHKYHKSPGIFRSMSIRKSHWQSWKSETAQISRPGRVVSAGWMPESRQCHVRSPLVTRELRLHSCRGCEWFWHFTIHDFSNETSYIFETNFWTSYPCFITTDHKFAQRMLKVSERSCSTSTWRFPCLPGRLGADDHVRSDLSF